MDEVIGAKICNYWMRMKRSKIEEFALCLREERFYDAHEALEALWFPRRFEKNNEVQLLKGLINASVALELLVHKKRVPQSKKVWANYLKYRPLLYKTDSPYKNHYYQLSRYLESIYREKSLKTH